MMRSCYRLRMARKPVEAACTECEVPVTLTDKSKIDKFKKNGRAYCTPECRDTWVKRASSQRMARTNRKYASQHMRKNNPMHNPESREKMRMTLGEIKHKPNRRGGNGKPPPEPQHRLAEFLGWPMEVVIVPKDGEQPYHYRVDIAHPSMKVTIEVDGSSHTSLERQESDRRKDKRLFGLGWLVFRFSNREAMERTEECARMVLSTTSKWTPRTPT